jgi:hypothetical protein
VAANFTTEITAADGKMRQTSADMTRPSFLRSFTTSRLPTERPHQIVCPISLSLASVSHPCWAAIGGGAFGLVELVFKLLVGAQQANNDPASSIDIVEAALYRPVGTGLEMRALEKADEEARKQGGGDVKVVWEMLREA